MITDVEFRQALGAFATGITVASTLDKDGRPHGLTVNSFNSVSLDPPLVLWSLNKQSHQLGIFAESGFYGISILADDQMEISNRFAAMIEDRFEGVSWHKGQTGAPLLDGALATFDCKVEKIVEGGDHVILIGRVLTVAKRDGVPLLYYEGGYKKLGSSF
nr:flavin reductase family protein [uncultured Cohaesibacter sp.]